jgi:hypothetical protein
MQVAKPAQLLVGTVFTNAASCISRLDGGNAFMLQPNWSSSQLDIGCHLDSACSRGVIHLCECDALLQDA